MLFLTTSAAGNMVFLSLPLSDPYSFVPLGEPLFLPHVGHSTVAWNSQVRVGGTTCVRVRRDQGSEVKSASPASQVTHGVPERQVETQDKNLRKSQVSAQLC